MSHVSAAGGQSRRDRRVEGEQAAIDDEAEAILPSRE
jgi:hypothetical protein